MKKIVFKKYFLGILVSLLGFLILSAIYYQTNSTYFGKVIIFSDSKNSISQIQAISPLDLKLEFKKSDSSYYYQYDRFYKSLIFSFANNSDSNSYVKVVFDDETVLLNYNNKKDYNFDLISQRKNAYSWENKQIDFFSFFIRKNKLLLISFVIILLALVALRIKEKLLLYFNKMIVELSKNKSFMIIFTILVSSIIAISHNSADFTNKLIIVKNQDQYIYQSCAINFLNGHEFLVGGKLDNVTDYKMVLERQDIIENFEGYAGFKRFDRFPGYIIFLTLIYKVFGTNPIAVKIIQFLLLLIISAFTIFTTQKFWGKQGYIAGLIATPIIIFNYTEFALMLSPDIISVGLNILIIYQYWKTRKSFDMKNNLILGLTLGISFLIKASLNVFVIFLLIDFLIIVYKDRYKLKSFFIFMLTFIVCWIPYNLWSITKSIQVRDNATTVLAKIGNDQNDTANLSFEFNKNFQYLGIEPYKTIFTSNDILVYNKLILPELQKKNYISGKTLVGLNQNQKSLYFLHLNKTAGVYYFMIKLYSMHGLMDFNNEFNITGTIHPEWADKQNSFYNTDNLSTHSQLFRVVNFYINNPKYILIISHNKLKNYFSNSEYLKWIVFAFLFLYGILNLVLFLKQKKKFKYIAIAILSIIILIMTITANNYLYLIISATILTIINDSFLKKFITLPIIAIIINLFAFPIIVFGESRYLIYYDTYLIVFLIFTSLYTASLIASKFNIKNQKN
jgi:4-amino-4-deoxy-L-arabinose transferase-like glycosyltransferase